MNFKYRLEKRILNDVLFVKNGQHFVRIRISEIDFVKSRGNNVEIHCGNEERVVKETLKKIQSRLDASLFFRVHRSYIVNMQKIERIGSNMLQVGEAEIPIIKQNKEHLLRLLNAL